LLAAKPLPRRQSEYLFPVKKTLFEISQKKSKKTGLMHKSRFTLVF
jgi:hypothetical protein